MLLLITDGIAADLSARVALAADVLGGLDVTIQLRAKAIVGADLFRSAANLVKILDQRLPLVVNDRLDVARAAGAAGVHLPSAGLPLAVARQLWPTARLGRSTHTLDEIAFAREAGADYVVYGPIAESPGKTPIGWDTLAGAVRLAGPMRVYALGGLDATHVARARALGAGVAMIRGGLGAVDDALVTVEKNLAALQHALA